MIEIKKIVTLSEQGKRQNNEDAKGYDLDKGTFIVCDGVGGVEKGEIASAITVETLMDVFSRQPDIDMQLAIAQAESVLSDYIQTHPDALGMATTLTLTRLRPDGILVAWIGDSRVYQFRKGRLMYRTEDHSWVNDAVKAGILTPEEAIDHPKSNVITRALQGQHKPVKADVQLIRDLQPGDLILQCSDGILESWDDDDLTAVFNSGDDIQSMLDTIANECREQSRDNYTAIIYEVGQVSLKQVPAPTRPEEPRLSADSSRQQVAPTLVQATSAARPAPQKNTFQRMMSAQIPLMPAIIICSLLAVAMYYFLIRPMMIPDGASGKIPVQMHQQRSSGRDGSSEQHESKPSSGETQPAQEPSTTSSNTPAAENVKPQQENGREQSSDAETQKPNPPTPKTEAVQKKEPEKDPKPNLQTTKPSGSTPTERKEKTVDQERQRKPNAGNATKNESKPKVKKTTGNQ